MSRWEQVRLADICDVTIGRTPPRERREYWDGDKPWSSIADLNQGRIIYRTAEGISALAVKERNCRLIPEGTVLLSFKLSVGKVAISGIPLFTNEAIAALPIKNGARVDTSYLAWALRSLDFTSGLDRAAKGLTLNKAKLVEIAVPLPPLLEQRRIAAILDQADALRAKRRAALAQLDEVARAIFVEMFGDPARNPKGWPTATLGQLIADGPQNGIYKPSSEYGDGTCILRIDSFYDGAVTKLTDLKRVRLSDAETRLYGLRGGDIVVTRVNSMEFLGKSALIPELGEPTVFESNMMRFAVDRARVEPC